MDVLGLSDLPFLPSIVTRTEIPEDIASVQTIDREAEVDPAAVGLAPESVDDIWGAALRWYRTGIHPAISMCVRVRGEVVLRRSIGYSHGAGPSDPEGTPRVMVTPETPFNVFSASKPMAAMVVHLLDQRHLLHLDDPVCEYIPEFAQQGKEWITIRHVLTHRAGIPTLPDAAFDLDYLEDVHNREAVRLLCDARPTSRAGGRLAYHAVTGGFLIGEIVRRVTGKNIRNVVDEEFCRPLGWRWMNFGVRRRDVPKVASSYVTGFPLVYPLRDFVQGMLGVDFVEAVELSNDPRYLMGVLPAANLIATADELCQFYELLLDGGELRGTRVFDHRTVWRATSEQSRNELDFTLGVPLRYGMGFMLGGEYVSLYGADSHHAFGHLGLTNIVAWADPQRHLSVAVMTSGKPVLYPEMHRGIALVYAVAAACPRDDEHPPRPKETVRRRKKAAASGGGAAGKNAETRRKKAPTRKKKAGAGRTSTAARRKTAGRKKDAATVKPGKPGKSGKSGSTKAKAASKKGGSGPKKAKAAGVGANARGRGGKRPRAAAKSGKVGTKKGPRRKR